MYSKIYSVTASKCGGGKKGGSKKGGKGSNKGCGK